MADIVEKLMGLGDAGAEVVLREDPVPSARTHPVVSVDDHVIEPPETFEGRMPARLSASRPRIERADGVDYWIFEDDRVPLLGVEGFQSWEPGKAHLGPIAFEEFRPGVWQIEERVRDMDRNGVIASLNFPSAIFGFAGQRFMRMKDAELGLASMRAYNDWIIEEWAAPHPDRIIPCQLTWLPDPEVAAAEVHRNAGRGFKAVTFSENPEKLGLPSIYRDHWDPFLRACEETGTVVNLHVGSSSETMFPSTDSDLSVLGVLFPVNAFASAADWLFARVPVRFPELKIVLSEGGIGWVPMLLDRLSYMARENDRRADFGGLTPVEVFRRNFWFASFSDERTLALRDEVGIDRIMFETDYPHPTCLYPEPLKNAAENLATLSESDQKKILSGNATRLYKLG